MAEIPAAESPVVVSPSNMDAPVQAEEPQEESNAVVEELNDADDGGILGVDDDTDADTVLEMNENQVVGIADDNVQKLLINDVQDAPQILNKINNVGSDENE